MPSSLFAFRRAHHFVIALFAFGCGSQSCVDQKPSSADSCGGGPNCVELDAGPQEPPEPVTVVQVDVDAAASVAPPRKDAGPREICPGICIPDDPFACGESTQLERSEVESKNLEVRISVAGLVNPDQTEKTSDGGVTALAASGDPVDAGAPGEGQAVAEAGSSNGSRSDAGAGDTPSDDDEPADIASDDGDTTSVDQTDSLPGAMTAGDVGARDSGLVGADAGDLSIVDASLGTPAALDVVGVDGGVGAPSDQPSGLSCQLAPLDDGIGAACAPAGVGVTGAPCSSARDCGPGLGCVGKVSAGQCLPYCCAGTDTCGAGSFCTVRPLRAPELADDSPLVVPVCAKAEQCDLMQPFPCPAGAPCSCPTGQACTAVGRDGAKTCVEPGVGGEGDACPCAPGYFCSPAQQTCHEMCRFGTDACGDGMCQAVGGFPEGFGLCAGVFESTQDPSE